MDNAPSRSRPFAMAVGIDVGKSALEVTLRDGDEVRSSTNVPNTSDGHEVLLHWLEAQGVRSEETCVCMEASGNFEETVARRLDENGYRVSVVNPRRIKGYASSQLQRTKTDSADAALMVCKSDPISTGSSGRRSCPWRTTGLNRDPIFAASMLALAARFKIKTGSEDGTSPQRCAHSAIPPEAVPT